jgi:hypothetical protein
MSAKSALDLQAMSTAEVLEYLQVLVRQISEDFDRLIDGDKRAEVPPAP